MSDKTTLTTPGGTSVVIKSFISGGDMEDLERVLLDNVVFDVDPETGKIQAGAQQIKASFNLDRTKKAIELLVVSVNDNTADVYKAVRALPVADYDYVIEKVQELATPLVKTPSTPLESSTTKPSSPVAATSTPAPGQ